MLLSSVATTWKFQGIVWSRQEWIVIVVLGGYLVLLAQARTHRTSHWSEHGNLVHHWSTHLWRQSPLWFLQSFWSPWHTSCGPRANYSWERSWLRSCLLAPKFLFTDSQDPVRQGLWGQKIGIPKSSCAFIDPGKNMRTFIWEGKIFSDPEGLC